MEENPDPGERTLPTATDHFGNFWAKIKPH
jgi:hypothetical protein